MATRAKQAQAETQSLSRDALQAMDAWWRAANYLSVGQIYLLDNPLLRKPLELAHIKPRLLGHWDTTPGLNFIYVHLNRLIRARNLNAILVAGPATAGRRSRPIPASKVATASCTPMCRRMLAA